MSAAIVQRRGRKAHLASQQPSGEWWTVCDLVVAADAAVTPLEVAAGTIDAHASDVCAHCRRLILMADVAHRLGVGRLVRTLDVAA